MARLIDGITHMFDDVTGPDRPLMTHAELDLLADKLSSARRQLVIRYTELDDDGKIFEQHADGRGCLCRGCEIDRLWDMRLELAEIVSYS